MFGLFQNLPRLPTMGSIRIIEDDAFVARKDRGVDCADIGVERGFADIERGLKPLLVYIGSFIRGTDKVEEEFYARAAELGITDDVIVSGYVASDHEVFGIFNEVDAFCYSLEEGITARRGSILACVQSGRPAVVTGPVEAGEFDHHARFKELIDRGIIILVPRGSSDEVYADRIASSLKRSSVQLPFNFGEWWRDVARSVQAQYQR